MGRRPEADAWARDPIPGPSTSARAPAAAARLDPLAHLINSRSVQIRCTGLDRVLADACDRRPGAISRASAPATSPGLDQRPAPCPRRR
ncbi:hypothetical protein [Streptomyces alfalfae]|uniref:hypothetical protein n=1 Tax=Streptomyces alfalfae TaxID=1642299 RepID=UPI000F4FA1AD|nr:hypothetical protein [Streptomyces alfalfae]